MPAAWTISLGETAETRRRAVRHHSGGAGRVRGARASAGHRPRWARASSTDEIVAVEVPAARATTMVDTRRASPRRRHPRLAGGAQAGVRRDGTVTAGNLERNQRRRGRAGHRERRARRELGLTPIARVVSTAVAGVDPSVMGLGPVPATRKALARAGLDVGRPRSHRAQRGLRRAGAGLHAGAAARSRPGQHLRRRHRARPSARRQRRPDPHDARARAAAATGGRYGLATMCIGVGQGIAMVVERVRGTAGRR